MSIIPLVVLVLIFGIQDNSSFQENTTTQTENEAVDFETDITPEIEVNFIDESFSNEVKSCSKIEACPCGGRCETDPGNVCTRCSEWSTGAKFVKCEESDGP